MSVCAVMLVKDEADIIEHTVRHLANEVDHVFVSDNGSTDGTRQILDDLMFEPLRGLLTVRDDPEVGYWQSAKTTRLAMEALQIGYQWVVPCDADEFWYAPGRTIRDLISGLPPDVQIVEAQLYNHIPTGLDAPTKPCPGCDGSGYEGLGTCRVCYGSGGVGNPFIRMGWRKLTHGVLPKVACRLRPDLVIGMGNHSATTDGTAVTSGGLVVRHYSWRSVDQYVRKIRNGAAAYRETNMDASVGAHWRMWDDKPDEALADHFRQWFWSADPRRDDTLIFDPAPVSYGGDVPSPVEAPAVEDPHDGHAGTEA